MKKSITTHLTQGAAIAALYVALTFLAHLLGLSSGAIQIRFSESLTILPYFTPVAVPGLFAGCLLANLLTGAAPLDILFGSLATLLGAWGTHMLCRNKKRRLLAPLPPILANTLIIPLLLIHVYGLEPAYIPLAISVAIGEALSCGLLGLGLLSALEKTGLRF